ncbi:MAG: UDP-N-acetylmuramate--L-alanine ligase [Glaciimonas sp.]|nr:UDP-N-acetylmuramate--L-alanine ligase [Glaciimonas sp.]
MKHAIRNIHFIGIGGAGMSGIAEVLHNLGYSVSGSDLIESSTLKRLGKLNIKTYVGHSIDNIFNADVVVISSAVKNDNPEVIAARDKKIPIVPRAVMLAELMRMKQGIAIAGTHGKTTTTSLIASILAEAGLDPTFVIGGRLNSADANAKLGSGDYIVVEADESDASFLNLLPVMAVVTNIDADHMETYDHDFEKLKNAFVEFLHKMPFYGAAILCIDNPAIREIIPFLERPILSYGFSKEAKIFATNVDAVGGEMHFVVHRHNNLEKPALSIKLNLPGLHNVLNALAAIAVATELDIADAAIQRALLQFKGVDRRFQNYGLFNAKHGGSFTLIDDYGHHPVEMRATIEAARGAFPNQRLVLAFQPHRYTRTRDCFEDFVKIISSVDVVLLAEVYSAGEAKIVGADGRTLTRALRLFGKVDPFFIDEITLMPEAIMNMTIDGDVVLCMGAGSIGSVPKIMMDQLNASKMLIQKETSV